MTWTRFKKIDKMYVLAEMKQNTLKKIAEDLGATGGPKGAAIVIANYDGDFSAIVWVRIKTRRNRVEWWPLGCHGQCREKATVKKLNNAYRKVKK